MGIETAILGAAALGGGASLFGASKAADAQKAAAAQAAQTQQAALDKQIELNAPFREGGLAAQNQLLTLLGLKPSGNVSGVSVNAADPNFGRYAGDFSMADYQADPGYAFRLDQGMKALQSSAAAKGLLSSGSTLKGITDYGQGLASQEYGNAYNRYQTNRANQLNPLMNLLGVGQTATGSNVAATGAAGQGIAQAQAAGGQAQAQGYANMGNAFNNALSTGLSAYNNYNSMNNLAAALRQSQYGNPVNVGSTTGYGI